ncbi:MAG: metallophosphoesterase [Clostridiales bacterium]|nr:metallophosphoesterase [Clostridiales bacterium]
MKKRRVICILIAALAGMAIFCYFQNNMLTVSRHEYASPKIGAALDGYKILQISDLHSKYFGAGQKRLLAAVVAQEPDIIVLTGDMVDSRSRDPGPALAFVKGAAAIAPVYYVTGNHEHRLEAAEFAGLMRDIEEAGATVLEDRAVEIAVGDESFLLIGLFDNSLTGGTLEELAQELDPGKLRVLLAHQPQYISRYAAVGTGLVFAGHAHGGQIRLPLIGGLVAPGQGLFPKYTAGLYAYGQATLAVSRGLGNSLFPLRVFNRPHILCVTLRAE